LNYPQTYLYYCSYFYFHGLWFWYAGWPKRCYPVDFVIDHFLLCLWVWSALNKWHGNMFFHDSDTSNLGGTPHPLKKNQNLKETQT
jgi:hypothetical protein